MITRVAGVLVVDAWSLRRAAERCYPGSRENQRRWMRAWASKPSAPREPIQIGSIAAREPDMFARLSHIPQGKLFARKRA